MFHGLIPQVDVSWAFPKPPDNANPRNCFLLANLVLLMNSPACRPFLFFWTLVTWLTILEIKKNESSGRIPYSFKLSVLRSESSLSSLRALNTSPRWYRVRGKIDRITWFVGVWCPSKLNGECVSQSNHCSSPAKFGRFLKPSGLFSSMMIK